MKLYSILLLTLLTGCSTTVPVVMKFPDIPPSLNEKCPALKKIEGESVTIVDLHKTVVENYTQYHECSTKVEGWMEWYTTQKKIYESVK
jgi:hypothetical protein